MASVEDSGFGNALMDYESDIKTVELIVVSLIVCIFLNDGSRFLTWRYLEIYSVPGETIKSF